MTGAERLRRYLDEKKQTQADFAARAGVSKASVSLWLAQHSLPGRSSALLIQSATGGAVPFAAWSTGGVGPKRHARRVSKPAA